MGFNTTGYQKKSAKVRRQELMQTFRKDYSLPKHNKLTFVDAWDIFDNPKPERSLVQDVRDALADIAPIRVMIAAGNHDYAYPGSVWLEKDKVAG